MSVPIIYLKQLAMLRRPFDARDQAGAFVPVIQWCADHEPVLKGVDAEARIAIETVTQSIELLLLACQRRLEALFPGDAAAPAAAPDAALDALDATLRVGEPE